MFFLKGEQKILKFEELEVWKESCRLAVDIYDTLKDCRDYRLKDQITRAAVSIPSNIAEGSERKSVKEYIQFLYIAKGSAAELRTQLYIAAKIGVLTQEQLSVLTNKAKIISRMLQKTIGSISASDRSL